MAPKVSFQRKPIPFLYSGFGSVVFTAFMKLHPVHRQLMKLEIRNMRDYFRQYSPSFLWRFLKYLKPIEMAYAAIYCYISAIRRIVRLGKQARQDYFALNRHGCFATDALPEDASEQGDGFLTPILIVPGLNTPPAFFRQMVEFFASKGYPVSVLDLPNKGLADVETASNALGQEIERLKTTYNASSVNIIGHCLGGLIGQHYLEQETNTGLTSSVKNMITLGTGFMGAEGVKILKGIWMDNHPTDVVPKVFDQLIEWNKNIAQKASQVAYHNFITVWDFMVYFKNAWLEDTAAEQAAHIPVNAPIPFSKKQVNNYIIDDSDIDHLTIVLSPKMFERIADALAS